MIPGIEKRESLDLAISGVSVPTESSAVNIAQLLMPDRITGGRLAFKQPKRLEDGKLDKAECFRVEGMWQRRPITVWIDKKSYPVRRIDEPRKFDTFRTERTTTYDPTINDKIADKMLEFGVTAPK